MAEDKVVEPDAKKTSIKTDDEIGRAIVSASRTLNDALIEACRAKLEVEIRVSDHAEPGLTRKAVSIHVWRKVHIA